MQKLAELFKQYNAVVTVVQSGFMDTGYDFGSDKIHLVKKPVVAMLTGEQSSSTATGEIWHLFEQQLDFPLILINADGLQQTNFKSIDVLIIPDGNYKILTEKESLLKNWVKAGGKIIALENAAAQMATGEWGIKIKKADHLICLGHNNTIKFYYCKSLSRISIEFACAVSPSRFAICAAIGPNFLKAFSPN